jgi:hypothetical protein
LELAIIIIYAMDTVKVMRVAVHNAILLPVVRNIQVTIYKMFNKKIKIMKKVFNTEKNEEIISLNTDLYDDFFVQELESRLETDPLTLGLGGLLELFGDCNGYYSCTDHCNDSAGGCFQYVWRKNFLYSNGLCRTSFLIGIF